MKISLVRTFAINNHITVYPSNYRGRQVTEANVQDYISNIVSKYLPTNLPPWQICVIPITNTTVVTHTDVASTSDQSNENDREHQSTNDSSTVIENKEFSASTRVSFACYVYFYTHYAFIAHMYNNHIHM